MFRLMVAVLILLRLSLHPRVMLSCTLADRRVCICYSPSVCILPQSQTRSMTEAGRYRWRSSSPTPCTQQGQVEHPSSFTACVPVIFAFWKYLKWAGNQATSRNRGKEKQRGNLLLQLAIATVWGKMQWSNWNEVRHQSDLLHVCGF